MFPVKDIPPRMYTSEVLKLARLSRSQLTKRRKDGEFPAPIDTRCKEDVYDGYAVYRALGLLGQDTASNDPWMAALNGQGHGHAA